MRRQKKHTPNLESHLLPGIQLQEMCQPTLGYKSDSVRRFFGSRKPIFVLVHFAYGDFQHHRLAFRDEIPLAARQLGEQRQFEPLHCRFNSSQMMSANGNLVRRENQLEVLLIAATGEFRENELIVWQQQRTPRRNLNA